MVVLEGFPLGAVWLGSDYLWTVFYWESCGGGQIVLDGFLLGAVWRGSDFVFGRVFMGRRVACVLRGRLCTCSSRRHYVMMMFASWSVPGSVYVVGFF